MDVIKWLIFSIPTTIAYTFECCELHGVALYLYRLIEPFDYLPSLHRQGLLYISFDTKYCDVERGKTLIQRAAEMGYKPSIVWLEKYGRITQASALTTKELIQAIGIGKYAESRRRILLVGLVLLLAVIAFEVIRS